MAGMEPKQSDEFDIREVTPEDGEVLRRLAESNPDGGEIQFAPRFRVDPYEMHSTLFPADDFAGFIAETPEGDPAGFGFISFNDSRIGGELKPRGYLAGLIVDHEHRGQGLGTRLAAERIRHAEEVTGDDVIISAAIQSGNEASMGVARSWADDFPYEYAIHPVETREQCPTTSYAFRTLDQPQLPEFVTGINSFYETAELFVPYRTERLSKLIEASIDGHSVHRCDVAIDDEEFVAGVHVADQYELMTQVVEDLPPELEQAEELPPSIPDDMEIRPKFVVPWFRKGYRDAAEQLIEYERAAADGANRVMIPFDPDGPLGELDTLSVDEGSIELQWALRGLDDPVDYAFVAPSLG